jgi:hypothetical protein
VCEAAFACARPLAGSVPRCLQQPTADSVVINHVGLSRAPFKTRVAVVLYDGFQPMSAGPGAQVTASTGRRVVVTQAATTAGARGQQERGPCSLSHNEWTVDSVTHGLADQRHTDLCHGWYL